MWIHDPDAMTLLDVNAATLSLFGYSKDQFLVLKLVDLGISEARPSGRVNLLNGRGETLNLRLASHTLAGPSPAVLVVAEDLSDLTHIESALKAAQKALDESEARFRILVDESPFGICLIQDGRFVYVNTALAKVCGYTPDEILQSPDIGVFDLIVPEDRVKVADIYRRRVNGLDAPIDYRFNVRHRGGQPITVEIHSTMIHYQGKPTVMGLGLDVRDRLQAEQALRVSESRYRLLFERSLAGMFKTSSKGGGFLECNEAMAHMLGYASREELLKLPVGELYFNPGDRRDLLAELRATGFLSNYEIRLRRKDGSLFWGIENITLLRDEAGQEEFLEGTLVDITGRKRLEELNLSQQQLLQMVAQNLPIAVVLQSVVDLVLQQLQSSGCAVLVKKESHLSLMASSGLPETFLTKLEGLGGEGHHPSSLTAHHLEKGTWPLLSAAMPSLESCWSLPILSGGNRRLGILVACLPHRRPLLREEAELLEMAGRMAAVALEHEELTEQLAHQIQHDALTGLPNRTLFTDRLAQAIARAKRNSQSVAVVFLDLDGFKQINDTLGHHAGDQLLQEVARRLGTAVRQCDTLARMSGDEFMVLVSDLKDSRDTLKVVQKCLDVFRTPFPAKGYGFFMDFSAGISVYPDDAEDPDVLIRHADAAMHRAKSEGRRSVQFYTSEMNAGARERLDLESRLRNAVQDRKFTLHYQPQFRGDGSLLGFEALMRWPHPELGFIPPSKFIPLAEETGLIVPLGAWCLDEACRQMATWERAGHKGLRMAVNVSLLQFEREDFVGTVKEVLERQGLHPRSLELELTESLVMKDAGIATQRLERLRELGVQIAIDDFGTGYSCLSYLQHLPIQTLKIDQSFVRDIQWGPAPSKGSDRPGSNRIIETIVALAYGLDMTLVAEGVETPAQLAFLQSLCCQAMQGYLMGRPMAPEDCEPVLERGRWDFLESSV